MVKWDGNYFYRDNFRIKSTGDDLEYLVSEIIIEDITYNKKMKSDSFQYDNDKVYMIFSLYKKDTDGLIDYNSTYYVLIKYDI